jgi:hypothetical protein
METKQTAVMYLLDWLMDNPLPNPDFVNAIKKAKQMEKEQIMKTWEQGNLPTNLGRVLTAEQYYNQTYGN